MCSLIQSTKVARCIVWRGVCVHIVHAGKGTSLPRVLSQEGGVHNTKQSGSYGVLNSPMLACLDSILILMNIKYTLTCYISKKTPIFLACLP